jgi:shikimate dehydrogenase
MKGHNDDCRHEHREGKSGNAHVQEGIRNGNYSQGGGSRQNTAEAMGKKPGGSRLQKEVQPRLFGVMAHPVGHSLSPLMHNAAFRALNLPHHYHAFDVPESKCKEAVQALNVLGLHGVNVTIPLKTTIMPELDEIDPEARVIGAVNTVVRNDRGILMGMNTDGSGYVRSLTEETGVHLPDMHAFIIGAGGAAKAIAVYLIKNGCRQLTIVNRTINKAEQLAELLRAYAADREWPVQVHVRPLPQVINAREVPYSLYINTTSRGMWPHVHEVPVRLHQLSPRTVVSDIVYNPLQTRFLKEAEEQGALIHPGLGMFIYQGALAFEHFTGQNAPVEVMRKVVLDVLQNKQAGS